MDLESEFSKFEKGLECDITRVEQYIQQGITTNRFDKDMIKKIIILIPRNCPKLINSCFPLFYNMESLNDTQKDLIKSIETTQQLSDKTNFIKNRLIQINNELKQDKVDPNILEAMKSQYIPNGPKIQIYKHQLFYYTFINPQAFSGNYNVINPNLMTIPHNTEIRTNFRFEVPQNQKIKLSFTHQTNSTESENSIKLFCFNSSGDINEYQKTISESNGVVKNGYLTFRKSDIVIETNVDKWEKYVNKTNSNFNVIVHRKDIHYNDVLTWNKINSVKVKNGKFYLELNKIIDNGTYSLKLINNEDFKDEFAFISNKTASTFSKIFEFTVLDKFFQISIKADSETNISDMKFELVG